MQRSILLISLSLAVSVSSVACTQEVQKGGKHIGEPALAQVAKVLPNEYADYKKHLAGDNGLADARAAIPLMLKARSLRASLPPPMQHMLPGQRPLGWEKRQDTVEAYRATWCLCLRLFRNSKDKMSQQLLLDEWNKSLQGGSECVPAQMVALQMNWDRRFLTDDFWKLLRDTKNTNTLAALCFVLDERGNREDAERLKTICDSLIRQNEDERAEIVGIRLVYMERRLENNSRPIKEIPPGFDE